MSTFQSLINSRIKSVFLLLFYIAGTNSLIAQAQPLYQPPPTGYVFYISNALDMGSYISEGAAVSACNDFLDGETCSAIILHDIPREVYAHSYRSTFINPGHHFKSGFIACHSTASWISECKNYVWLILPNGQCDDGYAPDESGRCALECENNMIRNTAGICNIPPSNNDQDFPDILNGIMDGLYDCIVSGEVNTLIGNPINYLTGNKVQHEIDFVMPGTNPFEISRTYNSNTGSWTMSFGRSIKVNFSDSTNSSISSITAIRHDGRRIVFDNSIGNGQFRSNIPGDGILETNWDNGNLVSINYVLPHGTTEIFNQHGSLIRINYRNGGSWDFQETLYGKRVEDASGRFFDIHVNTQGLATSIVFNGTNVVSYSYNSAKMIDTVLYPDETQIRYVYEVPNKPYLLTGKVEKDEYRSSTWAYDNDGLAIETYHLLSNGELAGRHSLEYDISSNGQDGTVTTTNPLGKKTTYTFETIAGIRKVVDVQGHATESCLAANKSYDYYENGLIKSSFGWSGTETYYEYNEDGLTTKIVNAKGTNIEQETRFIWHDNFRLPLEIIQPDRTTTFNYDAHGNLIRKSVQSR